MLFIPYIQYLRYANDVFLFTGPEEKCVRLSQCFIRLTRCKYLICIIVGDEYVSVYGEKKP